MFFVGARRGGLLIPLISIVLLAGVSLIMGGIIPAVFQRFRVEPQELARERALHRAQHRRHQQVVQPERGRRPRRSRPATTSPRAALQANRPTLDNIRLWDPEVLRPGVRNLQAIAQYYNFTDVDVDRYPIDGTTAPGDDLGPRGRPQRAGRVGPDLAEPAPGLHPRLRHRRGPGQHRRRRRPARLHRLRVQPQRTPRSRSTSRASTSASRRPTRPSSWSPTRPRASTTPRPPARPACSTTTGTGGRAALRHRPPAGLRRPLPRHQPADLRQHQGRLAADVQPRHPRAGRAGGPVPPVGRRPVRGGGRRQDQVRPRRLHHLRQLPVRPAHRPGRRRPPQRAGQPRGRGHRQLHPQLGQGRGRRLHRRGHPVRLRRAGPHPQGLAQGVPRPVRGQGRDPPEPQRATCATPRTCSRSRPGSTPATTSPTRTTSTPRRTSGPCPTTAPARSAARRTPAAWPPPPRSRPAPTTS